MTTLLKVFEKMKINENENEPEVIKDSDELYKQKNEWKQDIEYTEPNDYEKNLIKDTIKSHELIEKEKEEIVIEKTQEEKDKEYKEHYILRVKVIAMHKMGKSIISNPSYWKHEHKKELINEMQNILDLCSEEEIVNKFNFIVNENLLDGNFNYESFPLKRS